MIPAVSLQQLVIAINPSELLIQIIPTDSSKLTAIEGTEDYSIKMDQ